MRGGDRDAGRATGAYPRETHSEQCPINRPIGISAAKYTRMNSHIKININTIVMVQVRFWAKVMKKLLFRDFLFFYFYFLEL